MGGNLAKSPLVAVFYAALLHFTVVFLPFSEHYGSLLHSYEPQISPAQYLLMVAYCLWIVIPIAIVFSAAEPTKLKSFLLLLPTCLGLQWVVPLIQQLAFGEVTGVMTQKDTLLHLMQGCAATILILFLCFLLMSQKTAAHTPGTSSPKKYKLRYLRLVIVLLVLPFIYSILQFVLGYFLAWRNDAFRAYYQGGGNLGIMHMIINMLLYAPRYAVFSLLRGMLYALFSLPLLLLLPGKRVVYILCHTMLCLSGAILYLAPSPVMPAPVAVTHLIATAVVLVIYGGLSGYLLHLCVEAPKAAPLPAKAPTTAVKGAPAKADPPTTASKIAALNSTRRAR
ncbi:MAG: hypothetical protein ACOX0K_09290 [Oscillospiraceae bacterium]|jgi:hypothetical protein